MYKNRIRSIIDPFVDDLTINTKKVTKKLRELILENRNFHIYQRSLL